MALTVALTTSLMDSSGSLHSKLFDTKLLNNFTQTVLLYILRSKANYYQIIRQLAISWLSAKYTELCNSSFVGVRAGEATSLREGPDRQCILVSSSKRKEEHVPTTLHAGLYFLAHKTLTYIQYTTIYTNIYIYSVPQCFATFYFPEKAEILFI